jgi:hypothetical protein
MFNCFTYTGPNSAAEAFYYFPLNADSAVYQLECKLGNNRIVKGKVMEKAAARKAFQAAVDQGRHAAMLEVRGSSFAVCLSWLDSRAFH